MNRISFATRRDIFDILEYGFENAITNSKIYYFGRLTEIEFLSRLYDLNLYHLNFTEELVVFCKTNLI